MDARTDSRTASDSSHVYGSVPALDNGDAPSLDNGDGDAPPPRRCVAAVSLGLACISACVPLANKAVLRHGAKKAALTMTTCQLFGVALLFGLCHAVHSLYTGSPVRLSEVRRKARNIGPLGVAFGLKLGATNVGLALVSVEMHVLLAATDILWVAIFARLINGERVRNVTGGLALVGCFLGACLVSTDSYDAGRHVAFYAVALNLVGPVIQGIVVTLLRRSATREVARQNTSYVEFTFMKLAFSTATAGVLALVIEGVADARSCVVALLGDAPRFLTTVGLISGVQLLFTVLATYNAASDNFASRRWRTPTPPARHRRDQSLAGSRPAPASASSARSRSFPSGCWPLRSTGPPSTRDMSSASSS